MSTSIYNPSQESRRGSTTFRHRRSSVSLHSTPGLGLIKTISSNLVHGWHATTASEKEPSISPPSAPVSRAYKPRHAARDAMKGFTPTASHEAENATIQAANSYLDGQSDESSPRSRQDSLAPVSSITTGTTKPLACVKAGLIPDHSFDTWTAAWDSAYERRVKTNHHCATPATLPTSTSTSSTTSIKGQRAKNTRPPLTGRLSVTDAEVKRFVFGDREERRRSHESPDSFSMPRRGSEVPSLVLSDVSSRDSGLEDLEEGDEESDEETSNAVCEEEKAKLNVGVKNAKEKKFARIYVAPVISSPEVVQEHGSSV